MKILAIVGTGRKNGNVSKICRNIINGAEAAGIEGELINLFDYKINYCTGCRTCSKDGNGKCFHNDDFEKIVCKIIASDIIILGSPVYWGNVSAIMKTFFDRHMSVEYIYPKGNEYQRLPFFKKFSTLITETRKIKLRSGLNHKRFIIVTAMTGFAITDIFSRQASLFMKSIKKYIYGMKGVVIKTFVYTDTLFKFSKNKEEKILRRAFGFGMHLKISNNLRYKNE